MEDQNTFVAVKTWPLDWLTGQMLDIVPLHVDIYISHICFTLAGWV